jgi:outer membrane immunogenic protein
MIPVIFHAEDFAMNRMSIGIAALASFVATGALAADLPMKTPYTKAPAYVEPVFNWTGFYVGGNVGYSWGNSDNSTTLDRFNSGLPLVAGVNGTNTSRDNVNGVIGGGQFGYNWQMQNWLFGLEADIQGSGERGSSTITCVGCADVGTDIVTTLNQRLDWFGTARGRIGALVTPTVLLYATGGLAYGEVKVGGSVAGNGAGGNTTVVLADSSSTRVGWTLGAGVEGVISGNWTAKLEYLYMDLGTVSGGPVPLTGILVNARQLPGLSFSSRFTDNIVRAGINYHFNSPVVAKY